MSFQPSAMRCRYTAGPGDHGNLLRAAAPSPGCFPPWHHGHSAMSTECSLRIKFNCLRGCESEGCTTQSDVLRAQRPWCEWRLTLNDNLCNAFMLLCAFKAKWKALSCACACMVPEGSHELLGEAWVRAVEPYFTKWSQPTSSTRISLARYVGWYVSA